MTNPIYPDKTKTGLAALKPLTDVFFAEPERWTWQRAIRTDWSEITVAEATDECGPHGDYFNVYPACFRLTPKPRRARIGDQSYPEPCFVDLIVHDKWIADPIRDVASPADSYTSDMIEAARRSGYLFRSQDAAQQCLDAHRRARRVE